MPELPEVETTRRGIGPYVEGHRIERIIVRDRRFRYPIAEDLETRLAGQRVRGLERRGKYLLLALDEGTLLLHLGMSGSLRVLPALSPPIAHDHVDLILDSGLAVRLHDPRRFGALVWTEDSPETHPLLSALGPEPLGPVFDGEYLYRASRPRRCAVKILIMDAAVVVGVGNIYANESLYLAGIHPGRACNRIAATRYGLLAGAIRGVLGQAIEEGGTTLRDFVREDGNPGYFAQSLHVYGRAGEPCHRCSRPITLKRIGQRSSFYCGHCQR